VSEVNQQLVDLFGDNAPALLATKEERVFNVLPANWSAYLLYLESETQWRYLSTGMGGVVRTGLDYCAVKVVADALFGSEDFTKLFAKLKVIERFALHADSEKRERA